MKAWLWAHMKMLIGIFISTMLLKSGGIIGKVMGTLGLTFISYHYVMPEIRSYFQGYLNGLSTEVYNLVTYTKCDIAISMILSAGATKIASSLMLGKADS